MAEPETTDSSGVSDSWWFQAVAKQAADSAELIARAIAIETPPMLWTGVQMALFEVSERTLRRSPNDPDDWPVVLAAQVAAELGRELARTLDEDLLPDAVAVRSASQLAVRTGYALERHLGGEVGVGDTAALTDAMALTDDLCAAIRDSAGDDDPNAARQLRHVGLLGAASVLQTLVTRRRLEIDTRDLDGERLEQRGLRRRQEVLSQSEASAFIGAFEGAFEAIVNARQDGLIPPDSEEDVINLLRQFELAWHRSSIKTQQLELLLVELLEILNGDIEDEPRFRAEFESHGIDPATAAVIAHRLAMAIADAREHLGTLDGAESAAAVERVSDVADALIGAERSLTDIAKESVVSGAAEAVGAAVVVGAWKYNDLFVKIAREIVVGIGRLFERYYGV